MAKAKIGGLNRGLDFLIQDNKTFEHNQPEEVVNTGSIALIDINVIVPNPTQPRTDFDENAINELAESIKTLGIIQPLTLRKKDDKYEIISGERRYRASKIAGLTEVPAYITEADDSKALYNRLIEECHLTQEELSTRLGKGRSTIANSLRLLRLPDQMQAALRNKVITEGQIRPLISLDDPELQLDLFQKVLNYGLSARQVEMLVKDPDGYVFELEQKAQDEESGAENPDENPDDKKLMVKANRPKLTDEQKKLKKNFTQKFNVPVDLKLDSKGIYKLTFNLKSTEDYDKIIGILNNIQI